MNQGHRPDYTNPHRTQTLEKGIEKYDQVNSDFTHPSALPPVYRLTITAQAP
jgi:hypothetical protein